MKARRFLPLVHTRLTPRATVDLGALVDVPAGYVPANPAIVRHGDGWLVCVRCVNYTQDHKLRVTFHAGTDFHTVNRVVRLDADLRVDHHLDSLSTALDGLEDVRLFAHADGLYALASQPSTGMVLLPLADDLQSARPVPLPSPTGSTREKNWLPFSDGDALRFVYSFDPLIVVGGDGTVARGNPLVPLDFLVAGSTPGLPTGDGHLFVAHRRKVLLPSLRRAYVNRVHLLADGRVTPHGPWFTIGAPTVQFVAGMAVDDDRVLLSYGERDRAALIAVVDRTAFPGGALLVSPTPAPSPPA